jgi:hypothetical protein
LSRRLLVLAIPLACSRAPTEAPAHRDAGATQPSATVTASAPLGPPVLAKAEVVALMESLAAIHSEHSKDCARLTTELESFEQSRAGELVRAAPEVYGLIEADPPLAERLGRAMETIMTVSVACSNEPRFVALHARRQGKPVPAPSTGSAAPPASVVPPASSSR